MIKRYTREYTIYEIILQKDTINMATLLKHAQQILRDLNKTLISFYSKLCKHRKGVTIMRGSVMNTSFDYSVYFFLNSETPIRLRPL